MDDFAAQVTLFSLILLATVGYQIYRSIAANRNLPPSPLSIPVVGHLHLLKVPLHLSFFNLSRKYGHVFSFRFGSHPAVIVSSSSAAEECFTTNDVVLANRKNFSTMSKYVTYNFTTVASSSYGDHWRNLRRIGAIEIFSSKRLNLYTKVRNDEVRSLLINLGAQSRSGFSKVELKSMFSDMTLNNIMRMVAGKRYYGRGPAADVDEAKEFKEVMASIIANAGVGHIEDFLPFLRWVKGGKFEREIRHTAARCDRLLQGLIDEHRRKGKESSETTSATLIDRMLSLQQSEPEYYSDEIIKGFILIMLLAGTDTTAVTLEWAMTFLVNNPGVLEKAKNEVDALIGEDRLIEESDLSNLHYLQAVIMETLRLQPPAPLLVPHYSSDDCVIGGFDVSRNTMVIVNAWAIQRDPSVWEDPEIFNPDRFQERTNHESNRLMPFGLGRRACPGAGMAHRVMGLALGSMIQCFEWRRVGEELVDMTEATGSVISKKKPLVADCKARDIFIKQFPW